MNRIARGNTQIHGYSGRPQHTAKWADLAGSQQGTCELSNHGPLCLLILGVSLTGLRERWTSWRDVTSGGVCEGPPGELSVWAAALSETAGPRMCMGTKGLSRTKPWRRANSLCSNWGLQMDQEFPTPSQALEQGLNHSTSFPGSPACHP